MSSHLENDDVGNDGDDDDDDDLTNLQTFAIVAYVLMLLAAN